MAESERKIALLGKTGAGKSSLANTILKKECCEVNYTFNSGTKTWKETSGNVNGKNIIVVDTIGFFDTDMSEDELRLEIIQYMIKCASGIHAFLIVLKVEKFTAHEQAVIEKIFEVFSDGVQKYSVVVFTYGNELPEGMTIEEMVSKTARLSDLVKKCDNNCHVFDNRYWKETPREEYRSNQFQVEALLNTLDTVVEKNNGCCYTNEVLQTVNKVIEEEEENIRKQPGNLSETQIREQAKKSVFKKLQSRLAGFEPDTLLRAVFGVLVTVGAVIAALKGDATPNLLQATGMTLGALAANEVVTRALTTEKQKKQQ